MTTPQIPDTKNRKEGGAEIVTIQNTKNLYEESQKQTINSEMITTALTQKKGKTRDRKYKKQHSIGK